MLIGVMLHNKNNPLKHMSLWDAYTKSLINIHIRQLKDSSMFHSVIDVSCGSCQKSLYPRENRQYQTPTFFWITLHSQSQDDSFSPLWAQPLCASSSLQTSLLSFSDEGTVLVWQKLTPWTSCVTLLHCHTSLKNKSPPPPLCSVRHLFIEGVNMAVLIFITYTSSRFSESQCAPVIWH